MTPLLSTFRGANIVCTVLFNLLENPLGRGVQQPKAIILAYAALDFNFTCASPSSPMSLNTPVEPTFCSSFRQRG